MAYKQKLAFICTFKMVEMLLLPVNVWYCMDIDHEASGKQSQKN